LLGISLEQITPQKDTVRRLLDGAARHIADAKVKAISAEYHYTMCGLDDIYLTSGYERTDTDYGSGVTIHDMDGLHRAIGEHLVFAKKALNAKEVRFLRHGMDLSQAQLGDLLRVTDQTVARWEKGEVDIPGPADLILRALYLGVVSGKVDVRKLAEQLRAMDESAAGKQLFTPTERGWRPIAA
jgi:DNA-binding transcriptional regulator YiaG